MYSVVPVAKQTQKHTLPKPPSPKVVWCPMLGMGDLADVRGARKISPCRRGWRGNVRTIYGGLNSKSMGKAWRNMRKSLCK